MTHCHAGDSMPVIRGCMFIIPSCSNAAADRFAAAANFHNSHASLATQYDSKYPTVGWVAEGDAFGVQKASDHHRKEHAQRLEKQRAREQAQAQAQNGNAGEDGLDGCILQ